MASEKPSKPEKPRKEKGCVYNGGAPPQLRFSLVAGDAEPKSFHLRGTEQIIVIGRGPGSNLIVPAGGVSFTHCELYLRTRHREAVLCVRDVSKNLTSIRDARANAQDQPWREMDNQDEVLGHNFQIMVPARIRPGQTGEDTRVVITVLLALPDAYCEWKHTGRWLYQEKLGEGGLADVYRAVDMVGDLGEVAIKVSKFCNLPEASAYNRHIFALHREAMWSIQRLHNPASRNYQGQCADLFARYLEDHTGFKPHDKKDFDATRQYFEDPNFVWQTFQFAPKLAEQPYVVMELVDGKLLQSVIESKTLNDTKKRAIVKYCVEALIYMQNHHVIHRDFRGCNMFVQEADDSCVLKVIDLGFMVSIEEIQERNPNPAVCCAWSGDPSKKLRFDWAPPEVRPRGSPNFVFPACSFDVFSCGVLIMKLLRGRVWTKDALQNNNLILLQHAKPEIEALGLNYDMLIRMLDDKPQNRPTPQEIQAFLQQENACAGNDISDLPWKLAESPGGGAGEEMYEEPSPASGRRAPWNAAFTPVLTPAFDMVHDATMMLPEMSVHAPGIPLAPLGIEAHEAVFETMHPWMQCHGNVVSSNQNSDLPFLPVYPPCQAMPLSLTQPTAPIYGNHAPFTPLISRGQIDAQFSHSWIQQPVPLPRPLASMSQGVPHTPQVVQDQSAILAFQGGHANMQPMTPQDNMNEIPRTPPQGHSHDEFLGGYHPPIQVQPADQLVLRAPSPEMMFQQQPEQFGAFATQAVSEELSMNAMGEEQVTATMPMYFDPSPVQSQLALSAPSPKAVPPALMPPQPLTDEISWEPQQDWPETIAPSSQPAPALPAPALPAPALPAPALPAPALPALPPPVPPARPGPVKHKQPPPPPPPPPRFHSRMSSAPSVDFPESSMEYQCTNESWTGAEQDNGLRTIRLPDPCSGNGITGEDNGLRTIRPPDLCSDSVISGEDNGLRTIRPPDPCIVNGTPGEDNELRTMIPSDTCTDDGTQGEPPMPYPGGDQQTGHCIPDAQRSVETAPVSEDVNQEDAPHTMNEQYAICIHRIPETTATEETAATTATTPTPRRVPQGRVRRPRAADCHAAAARDADHENKSACEDANDRMHFNMESVTDRETPPVQNSWTEQEPSKHMLSASDTASPLTNDRMFGSDMAEGRRRRSHTQCNGDVDNYGMHMHKSPESALLKKRRLWGSSEDSCGYVPTPPPPKVTKEIENVRSSNVHGGIPRGFNDQWRRQQEQQQHQQQQQQQQQQHQSPNSGDHSWRCWGSGSNADDNYRPRQDRRRPRHWQRQDRRRQHEQHANENWW